MSESIKDGPIEQRVVALREMSRSADQQQELATLEDYVVWKHSGGPNKLAAKRFADQMAHSEEIQRAER